MTKHTLHLPIGWDKGRLAPWNVTLLRMLVESGRFAYPLLAEFDLGFKHPRAKHLNAIQVDEQLILLDTWDTDDPLSVAWDNGEPAWFPLLPDLAIKIQWRPGVAVWERMEIRGVPVRPWTIFPCSQFPLGYFRYRHDFPHAWLGAITGERRWGRGAFADEGCRLKDCFVGTMGRWADRTPWAEYLNVLRDCRWGISLGGRKGTDRKNRREAEYASCGMPLALNYEPHYPFDFRPGTEYFKLDTPADLALLRDVDPRPFAEASRYLWDKRFSPPGMAATLLELLGRS